MAKGTHGLSLMERNVVKTIATNALKRMAFVGTSNMSFRPFGGRGFHYTAAPKYRIWANRSICDSLLKGQMHYHAWVTSFHSTDEGVEATTEVLKIESTTIISAMESVVEHVNALAASSDKFIGFGYYISMNDKIDLTDNATDDVLVNSYLETGLEDQSTHIENCKHIPTIEEVQSLITRDLRKFDSRISRHTNDTHGYVEAGATND